MTYTMHDPFGAIVEVNSLEEARRAVAKYIAVIEYSLRKFEAAVDTKDERSEEHTSELQSHS